MDREWLSSYKGLKTAGIIFLGFATLFVFVKTIGTIRNWHDADVATANVPQISVTGTGDVTAIPDVAQFSYTVSETGKTTKEAQDKASTKTNAVLSYLKGANIAEKDIKTVGYNVNPRYEYQTKICSTTPCTPGTQVLIGYEVSQTVQVKVRDTTKAGDILSGIGNLNVSNVSGLDLTIDDQTKVEQDARKKAIDDAEAKAQALARDLGVHLVRIVSFQESGTPNPIFYGAALKSQSLDSAAVAPAPQIPTGENKITSTVTITYEIR